MRLASLSLLCVLLPSSAAAELDRIDIRSRTTLLNGESFGLAGPYEKLIGKVYFSFDPEASQNAPVADIALARRDENGRVAAAADLYILKPVDPSRGNGAIFFDVLNRGRKLALGPFHQAERSLDPTTHAELGDGFLFRRGYTVVWVGWQFDVARGGSRMALEAPEVELQEGDATGPVRYWFRPNEATSKHNLPARGSIPYPVAEPSSDAHRLTVREGILDEREPIARERWRFEVQGDSISIRLDGGFEPGRLYEVVYQSSAPRAAGLGFAAVRDAISHLRYDTDLLGEVEYTYAFGASQSGRFLRGFLHQGFNRDLGDRPVFDGVIETIGAAVRSGFNRRFVQPSIVEPARFPFSDVPQLDPETGRTEGLLDHVGLRPKIFHLNTSNEYWTESKAAAMVHASIDGKHDLELPDDVRLYTIAGAQHGDGSFPPAVANPRSQHLTNPNRYSWTLRALLVAMDAWVRDGTTPPPSLYPRLADGSLVTREALSFPKIPGVSPPETVVGAYRYHDGPRFVDGIADVVPPRLGKPFPVLLPQVEADGNEIAGIRLPEIAVPLATYTGWNLRHPDIGAPGELVRLRGSFLPFAHTRAEREASNDPRLSIEERYPSRAHYVGLYTEAALELAEKGYLLDEDVPAIIRHASKLWDYATRAAEP